MEAYYIMLKTRLFAAMDLPRGLVDSLVTSVTFHISAAGVISDVRIARASGSRDFDAAVLAAFTRVRLPAKPDQRAEELALSFRTKDIANAR
jgi:TonB family protein